MLELSSTAFGGLYSLVYLDLRENQLTQLPQDVFSDLSLLQYLYLSANVFTEIPSRALAPLYLLTHFMFDNYAITPDIDLNGFQDLSNLQWLVFHLQHPEANMTKNIINHLAKLPLDIFTFMWQWGQTTYSVDRDLFAPITCTLKGGTAPQASFWTVFAFFSKTTTYW